MTEVIIVTTKPVHIGIADLHDILGLGYPGAVRPLGADYGLPGVWHFAGERD